jgi:DEAD/DEAH box helicase
MGVRGFNKLLRQKGLLTNPIIPEDSCGCSFSPWKADVNNNNNDDLSDRPPPFQKIPDGSQLLIDGNGLAFYLHSIAYSRYLRVLSKSSGLNESCCPRTDELDPTQLSMALPSMLPLRILHDVTNEFIDDMKTYMKVKVFWDGKVRRFKSLTDEKRRQQRLEEESNLEHYCHHGILPQGTKHCCQLQNHFPFSNMFLTCVKHALGGSSFVEMVECDEEADEYLARSAFGDPTAFVVGYDSDFYFYKDIQYLPLHHMKVGSSGLHAFCSRRHEIACSLGLDDDQMIDLALLMGNDYVDLPKLQLPKEVKVRNVESIIVYLRSNNDYQATAKRDTDQLAVDFVRALYGLNNLDEFPVDMMDPDDVKNKDDTDVHRELAVASTLIDEGPVVLDTDASIMHGIFRYLQSISGRQSEINLSLCFSQISRAFTEANRAMDSSHNVFLSVRPSWEEIKATWFIQSVIIKQYRSLASKSPFDCSSPLYTAFNPVSYLSKLTSFRHRTVASKSMPKEASDTSAAIANDNTKGKQTNSGLPIDEFESQIIQSIRQNRVTVIHGETGCGKSSRIPIMLLNAPAPDGSLRQVKFFISQPRRIAAKALVERVRKCEPSHKRKFAIRMGHGWREYETSETQAIFVTVGYLVRLLANHPEKFNKCTHLVIDEVHERSGM